MYLRKILRKKETARASLREISPTVSVQSSVEMKTIQNHIAHLLVFSLWN